MPSILSEKRLFATRMLLLSALGMAGCLVGAACSQGAYTEFYCNASTGSNMNGGSDENASPSYTATNGGWNSGTGVFTPASGNPSASVTVGQFASVFTDGATTPVFVGRVTAVNTTTVTVSTTAKSGTAPSTAASGISIKVGGVWKGPNGTSGFPLNFITNTLTNASSNAARINLKNNATYSITAAITTNTGPFTFRGYTTTVADGGSFTLDGGTSGAAYTPLTVGHNTLLYDAIVQNNGATGSADGIVVTGNDCIVRNVIVRHLLGAGLTYNGQYGTVIECEATDCNQSNASGNNAGFSATGAGVRFVRCYSHDNTGSNGRGFNIPHTAIDCIADSNGGIGFYLLYFTDKGAYASGCDAYNNGGHGFAIGSGSAASIVVENCNAVKNGGYGFADASAGGTTDGYIINCGVGSGTQANASGDVDSTLTSTRRMDVSGTVTYASGVTPWNDPANGNFTITLSAAKGAGRGVFLGTTNTTGFPDIGAAQSRGGSGISRSRSANQ